MAEMPASLFPLFLKLEGRPCLVVGAGTIAASKIASLIEAGANVTVVAPWASDELRKLAGDGKFRWLARKYEASDLDGVFLVIAATSDSSVNRAVFLEAQRLGILCNAVDDPPHCDFYFPAVVRRGDLQIAISTAGQSPALAQRLRRELEEVFDESAGDWVSDLGRRRREILATYAASEERKQWLVELAYSQRPGLKRSDARERELGITPVEAREVKS
jgi:precorrin-2 dehydrogenase / sirohydrochlorin ferrochelatase